MGLRGVHIATLSALAGCALLAVCQLVLQPRKLRSGSPVALEYKPPWEQTPPHFNRYRFAHKAGVQQQQLAQIAASKHTRFGGKAGSVTGKKIFANLRAAVKGGKNIKDFQPGSPQLSHFIKRLTKGSQLAIQQSKAESAEASVDEEEKGVATTVYVYDGRETKSFSRDLVSYILAAGFGMPNIRYIKSSSDADVRSATWDDDCRMIIFPPLKDIPDFGPNAVKDIRHYVSKGTNHAGTVLFMGSSVEVHLVNEIFGLDLQQDFKEGPYYKNARSTMGTMFQPLPKRVNELGNTENLGLLKSSMAPETASYYDSFGDSVASCMRWDLGRVCYLAQDFGPLTDLPNLQLKVESDNEAEVHDAEWQLEILSRKTDTWLAIFQAMVEQPAYATY